MNGVSSVRPPAQRIGSALLEYDGYLLAFLLAGFVICGLGAAFVCLLLAFGTVPDWLVASATTF